MVGTALVVWSLASALSSTLAATQEAPVQTRIVKGLKDMWRRAKAARSMPAGRKVFAPDCTPPTWSISWRIPISVWATIRNRTGTN